MVIADGSLVTANSVDNSDRKFKIFSYIIVPSSKTFYFL